MANPSATFGLTWDDSQLIIGCTRSARQLVIGTVNALNNAAKRLQQAEFAQVRSEFTIRKDGYFFGTTDRPGGVAARITAFASRPREKVPAGRLYSEVSVGHGSQASQRRTLLGLFERGGLRTPMTPGAKHIAAPITGSPARPTFGAGVPQPYTIAGLGFRAFRRGKLVKRRRKNRTVPETLFGEFGRLERSQLQQRDLQWKGKNRTFILLHTRAQSDGGIFQRIGPGRGDIIELYRFLKPFALRPDLHWLDLARTVGPGLLHEEIVAAADDAFAHNRAKGLV